jgi:hypothetical protein
MGNHVRQWFVWLIGAIQLIGYVVGVERSDTYIYPSTAIVYIEADVFG